MLWLVCMLRRRTETENVLFLLPFKKRSVLTLAAHTKIKIIQRVSWPLYKGDMQICEMFHNAKNIMYLQWGQFNILYLFKHHNHLVMCLLYLLEIIQLLRLQHWVSCCHLCFYSMFIVHWNAFYPEDTDNSTPQSITLSKGDALGPNVKSINYL